MNMEEIVFTLILHAGNARSNYMEAIGLAREGNFSDIERLMAEGREELCKAHTIQTNLLQNEAGGNKTDVSLLLLHAQDHLMCAILAKELVEEMIYLHKKVTELENKN